MNIKAPTYEDFYNYSGLHCHKLWVEVGNDFVCPSCNRNKYQILRWTTRFPNRPNAFEGWVAILHRHHDHSRGTMNSILERFPLTVICDQCNSSDGVVKRKLKLPKYFSFSPQEIACFIQATAHGKHKIDYKLAQTIYDDITNKHRY